MALRIYRATTIISELNGILKVIGIPRLKKKNQQRRGTGNVSVFQWQVLATLSRKVMMGITEKLTFEQRLEKAM